MIVQQPLNWEVRRWEPTDALREAEDARTHGRGSEQACERGDARTGELVPSGSSSRRAGRKRR